MAQSSTEIDVFTISRTTHYRHHPAPSTLFTLILSKPGVCGPYKRPNHTGFKLLGQVAQVAAVAEVNFSGPDVVSVLINGIADDIPALVADAIRDALE